VVSSLAQKYNKTAAQVLLRWATQRGLAVIPKTSDPKRLIENLDCNSFDLTLDEMKAIGALNKNIRFNNPPDVRILLPHISPPDIKLITLFKYLGELHIFA